MFCHSMLLNKQPNSFNFNLIEIDILFTLNEKRSTDDDENRSLRYRTFIVFLKCIYRPKANSLSLISLTAQKYL